MERETADCYSLADGCQKMAKKSEHRLRTGLEIAADRVIAARADGAGNAGFSNPLTFTASNTYSTVPEPSTAALLLGGSAAATWFLARRKRS